MLLTMLRRQIIMSKIITISREFGSGGHFIGENVAKKLGITFYDSQILEKIAEETGFCDIYYFSRVFRKKTGMSPTEYLKMLHK